LPDYHDDEYKDVSTYVIMCVCVCVCVV
jgi:hypothetical protein